MKYFFNIYTLESLKQGNTNPTYVIGYDPSVVDLWLISIDSLNYSYTTFSARSKITVAGFERVSPNSGVLTPMDAIQTGDIISCFENNVPIYYGYILKTTEVYSSGGKVLTLEFDTLLSHFTRQNMIQSSEDVFTLSPSGIPIVNTDIVSNKVKISDLLSFLISNSVYSDVNQIFKTIDIEYNAPQWMDASTEVYYYPSTQSTKEQVLLSSVLYYQVVIYQDVTGNIVITVPSTNLKSSYNIDTTSSIGTDPNVRTYEIIHNEAELPNNVVVSLIYAGFFPTPGQACTISTPNPTAFPRSSFLYTSGYFSQVLLDLESLQNSFITDPNLLNLLNNLSQEGVTYKTPPNTSQLDTAIGLLSSRYLAQSLTFSSYVVLELERNPTTSEIPLGKIFTLNNKQWLCINCTIDLVIDGTGKNVKNTLKLIGVPLQSVTGAWQ